MLAEMEEAELHRPSPRKQVDELTIHTSRMMKGGRGLLTTCDLGHARIGEKHRGFAMPTQYRAPEVILDMEWGNQVDLWSVGLIVWSFSRFLLSSSMPFVLSPFLCLNLTFKL